MELNEFKKAWKEANSERDPSKKLDAAAIRELLKRRSTGILSRLDKSVKILVWFLVFFFLFTIADQFLPADLLFPAHLRGNLEVPRWISILEWIVNFILMLIILLFVVKYRKLQLQTIANQNLKGAIEKVLYLLDIFKKGFYLALIILISGISLGFLSGANKGFETIRLSESPSIFAVVLVVLAMLVLLGLLIGSIFYIFHKGFNVLFGKYRDQLIHSLNELQENEE